jgi:2-polyprenyl-3-methyl-5-hydroxy-6-metoxy-1,4-benzoquinol methylase
MLPARGGVRLCGGVSTVVDGCPSMSKYDTEVDLENTGTSHAIIVDLVGHNKTVLDVGCATGYLARVLRERGCKVSGAEVDRAAALEAEEYLE